MLNSGFCAYFLPHPPGRCRKGEEKGDRMKDTERPGPLCRRRSKRGEALETVLREIPRLNKQERQTLRGRLEALSTPERSAADEVYEVTATLLGRKGLPPLQVVLQSRFAKQFRDAAGALERFIGEVFGPLRQPARRRVMRILLECALEDVRSQGIRVSVNSVACSIRDVWAVADRHFPGYLESGLFATAILGRLSRRIETHGSN
jgi:hypothetical protein